MISTLLLDRGLAHVANRRNMDDHVVLLELPVNHKREEAVALELEQERFFPRIELQGIVFLHHASLPSLCHVCL